MPWNKDKLIRNHQVPSSNLGVGSIIFNNLRQVKDPEDLS